MQRFLLGLAAFSLALLTACGAATPTTAPAPTATSAVVDTSSQPQHVTVQHILIGFKGTIPGKDVTRTQQEAQQLAEDVFNQAKSGADFDSLVAKYTDDSPPGIYSMSNNGVTPAQGETPRNGMIPAFGDVGFSLKVGEIGLAEYDPVNSPYGWHIIKRLK